MSVVHEAPPVAHTSPDAPPPSTAIPHGRVPRWVARHPLTSFFVVTFGVAYPVMSVPILAAHGVLPSGWLALVPGVDTERVASVLLVFLALVPATTVVTWATGGRRALRALAGRALRWDIGARWWLLVLAGMPVLTLGLAILLGDAVRPVDLPSFVGAQVLGLLVNLVLINLWEETAWAGLVQTTLERSYGVVRAALVTAVPFAMAHLPLHFIGDVTVASVTTALITLLVVCALVRLMLGVVLRGTRGSVLAVAVLHTMFNRSNNDDGVVAGLVSGDGRKLAGLIAVLVLTGVVAVVARHRPSRSDRPALRTVTPRHAPCTSMTEGER
jgi:membrane protease YdiL (CAAX protease family)